MSIIFLLCYILKMFLVLGYLRMNASIGYRYEEFIFLGISHYNRPHTLHLDI